METWARFGGDLTSFNFEDDLSGIKSSLKSFDHNDKRRTFILFCSPENIKKILELVCADLPHFNTKNI